MIPKSQAVERIRSLSRKFFPESVFSVSETYLSFSLSGCPRAKKSGIRIAQSKEDKEDQEPIRYGDQQGSHPLNTHEKGGQWVPEGIWPGFAKPVGQMKVNQSASANWTQGFICPYTICVTKKHPLPQNILGTSGS